MRNPASPPLIVTSEADIAAAARYRLYVLYRLPRLQFLDAAPVTAAELAEAAVKGPFCAPKKPGSSGGATSRSSSSCARCCR
jgi:hypothetical protein